VLNEHFFISSKVSETRKQAVQLNRFQTRNGAASVAVTVRVTNIV